MLADDGCVDIAEYAVGERDGRDELVAAVKKRGRHGITDPLAGERHILGEGAQEHGVGVERKH